MSAYMRVNMILGKLCDLCQFQTYARRKTLLNIRSRVTGSMLIHIYRETPASLTHVTDLTLYTNDCICSDRIKIRNYTDPFKFALPDVMMEFMGCLDLTERPPKYRKDQRIIGN